MYESVHRLHPFAISVTLLLLCAGCDPPKAPPDVTTQSAAPHRKPDPPSIEEQARVMAQSFIIADGHIDLPFRLHMTEKKGPVDVTKATDEGDFDWIRARSGGLDAPFMSIYVPASYQKDGGAKAFADILIDRVERIVRDAPDKFAIAHSVADVYQSFKSKRVALALGIENGAALEGKLENVVHFHGRGVRYITLTHSKDNDICDSSYDDTRTHKGMSDFGRQVVAEMNRVGIMIDVSHISDDAFWQVMDHTKTPVIASHSSCRHFTPGFERNMSDDMIKRLAAGGGVIMINYGSTFLTKNARAWSDGAKAARVAFMKAEGIEEHHSPEIKTWFESYKRKHPLPYADVTDVADHIEHVIKLVGIEHVGLGSDFDGVGDSLPNGLKNPSDLPNLIAELLRRGVTAADIAKICFINVARVWGKVDAHAKAPG